MEGSLLAGVSIKVTRPETTDNNSNQDLKTFKTKLNFVQIFFLTKYGSLHQLGPNK